MKFSKLLLVTLTIIFSYSLAANAADNERWFQVEVMIFKNPPLETDNPESWPAFQEIEHPDSYIRLQGISEILTTNSNIDESINGVESNTPDSSIEIAAPQSDKGLEAFKALSEFERQLIEESEKIKSLRNYELLFHEAWNQPVPGKDEVIPIRIDAGERFGRQSELQGYISLYVERYLHFSTDLHLIKYQKSKDPFSVISEPEVSTDNFQLLNDFGGISLLNADSLTNNQITRHSNEFFISVSNAKLKESRRMRSQQVNYLDNPEFGLLILITPIDVQ
jgi:hypothetical protein